MTNTETKINITEAQLAHIGEGVVAYLREMPSEELNGKFPTLPKIEPGTRLVGAVRRQWPADLTG